MFAFAQQKGCWIVLVYLSEKPGPIESKIIHTKFMYPWCASTSLGAVQFS